MEIRIRGDVRRQLIRLTVAACLLGAVEAVGLLAGLKLAAGKQESARNIEKSRREPAVRSVPVVFERSRRPRPARGSVLGRFEVPALKMSWVVLEGTDDRTLERSIGHIEGTAGLGEAGNIGIAGHRNTHFRKLEWIRLGDEIVLTSKDGVFRYRVDYIRIHKPTDVDVLGAAHGPGVTLVTCFPFEYVGSAPLRHIVHAMAVEESLTRLLPPAPARYPVAGR